MKRYEKMTKEEIIEIINSTENCDTCLIEKECPRFKLHTCNGTVRSWLNEEIEMIPRAWTFKTAEEAQETRNELLSYYCKNIKCTECKYQNLVDCMFNWLYERVEKNESI